MGWPSAGLCAVALSILAGPALAQLQPPNVTRFPDPSQTNRPAPPQPAEKAGAKDDGGDDPGARTDGRGVTTEVTRESGKTTVTTTVPAEPQYNPMGAGGYRPMGR